MATSKEESVEDASGESDSSDDEELLAAAAQWAGADADDADDAKSDSRTATSKPPREEVQSTKQWSLHVTQLSFDARTATSKPPREEVQSTKQWSLHVTQLSFDATDYDGRTLFVSRGCFVSSVHLVYDTDPFSRQKIFRGVAFVDVADETSFKKALHLDRLSWKGRRINVRPTWTKSELTSIVQQTKEKVALEITKRKREKSEKEEAGHGGKGKQKKPAGKHKRKSETSDRTDSEKQQVPEKGNGKPKSPYRKGRKTKLTKKQRNRRAAILASRMKKNR